MLLVSSFCCNNSLIFLLLKFFLSPFVSFLGKQINVSDLKKALKDMKVEVTDKEYLNLVKTLPVDGKDFKIIYVFFKWL